MMIEIKGEALGFLVIPGASGSFDAEKSRIVLSVTRFETLSGVYAW
jgi:hypothetical protein